MRNILFAFATGIVAGQAFSLYREIKLKRINALEGEIAELLANQSPANHSPQLEHVRDTYGR